MLLRQQDKQKVVYYCFNSTYRHLCRCPFEGLIVIKLMRNSDAVNCDTAVTHESYLITYRILKILSI